MENMKSKSMLRLVIIILSFDIAVTSISACLVYLASQKVIEGEPRLLYCLGLKIRDDGIYVRPHGVFVSIGEEGSWYSIETWRIFEDCEIVAILNVSNKYYEVSSQTICPTALTYRMLQKPLVSKDYVAKFINNVNVKEAYLIIELRFHRIELAQDFLYDSSIELKTQDLLLKRPWSIKLAIIPLRIEDKNIAYNTSKIIVTRLYHWIRVEKHKLNEKELTINYEIDVKGSELSVLTDKVHILPSQSIIARSQFTLLSLILMIVLIPYTITVIYYTSTRQIKAH